MGKINIKKYVHRELDKGFHFETIRKVLVGAGYKKSEIDKYKPKTNHEDDHHIVKHESYFYLTILSINVVVFGILFIVYVNNGTTWFQDERFFQNNFTEVYNETQLQEHLLKLDYRYLDKGANNNNISTCYQIKDTEIRKACLSVIFYDVDMCRESKSGVARELCLVQLGEFMANSSICERELNSTVKRSCVEFFS